jgi:hypothetical protein
MNFLGLHNQVLMRLRENTITSAAVDSNPFYRIIGTTINDAKDAVENAWNFSSLRGEEEYSMVVGNEVVTFPATADSNYLTQSIVIKERGLFLRLRTADWMKKRYANDDTVPVPNGLPTDAAPYYNDSSGDMQFRVYPRPDDTYTAVVDRTRHQALLTAWDDDLLVPSLPVYSLATALASRERGEVGGAPVSELFAIADSHMSDAIAIDSARYPEENIWFVDSNMDETNNRFNY